MAPDIAGNSPTAEFALEAWVKPNSVGTDQVILSKYGHYSTTGGADDQLDGYVLRINTSAQLLMRVGYATSASIVTGSRQLEAGRWHHVVGTVASGTARLYVNGQLDASMAVSAPLTRSPTPLYIGARSGPSWDRGKDPWSGRIDEVAIYDSPLTAAQVTEHFGQGAPAPESVARPSISGNLAEDSTLTVGDGTWSAPSAPAFTYRWSRCPDASATACEAIYGATGKTYVLQSADVGKRIVARVTATNSSGFATADSSLSSAIRPYDEGRPEVTLSGSLWDERASWVRGGSRGLHIAAVDGTTAMPGSGVHSIEVQIDGTRDAYWVQNCTTRNCAMAQDYSLDMDGRGDGMHSISVVVTDELGNVTTTPVTLGLDREQPTAYLSGTMRDDLAAELTSGNYSLHVSAADTAAANTTSGVARISVDVDGVRVSDSEQPCAPGSCALAHDFTYRPSDYGEGDHGIRVVVSDGAGNESVTEWTARGHLSTPCDSNAASTAPVGDTPPGSDPVTTTTAKDAVADVQPELVDDDSGDPPPPPGVEDPAFDGSGATLATTGTAATTTVDSNPRNGFTTALNGTRICVRPIATDPAARDAAVVADNAAVQANTGDSADTVVKPTPTGVETFTSVRDGSASETYSWKVESPGMVLQQAGSGAVNIVDPDAHRSLSDAGLKPVDKPADPAEIPALVNDASLLEETAPADPAAAQQADDAIDAVEPDPAADLPADATEPIVGDSPAQPPPDATPTEDPDDIGERAQHVLGETQQQAADDLAQIRADAAAATTADEGARASDNAAAVEGPVVVGKITAPSAVDANGNAVDTTLSVAGDTVTMHVDHQAEGVAYPVVADPWVTVQHSRVVWRCCSPVYRWESRFDHWENRLHHVGWAPRSAIFSRPHRALGSGFYEVNWGGWFGRTLMVDQPISPVYIALPWPVYRSVPVLDHWEWYAATETYETREWRDDPNPVNPYPDRTVTDETPDSEPNDDFDAAESAWYCYSDAGNPDSSYCGDTDGSNAALQAARNEPPAAASLAPGNTALAKAIAADPQWGMSDQQAASFGDDNYKHLGLKKARLIVPYNVMDYDAADDARVATEAWLREAQLAEVRVLVSFSFDWRNTDDPAPSRSVYQTATNKFLAAYPWVKDYTAWNEPNLTKYLKKNPELAGQLHRNLARRCDSRGCVVAAGDFSDRGLKNDYIKRYKKAAGSAPEIWAFHSYKSGTQSNCDFRAERNWKRCELTKFLHTTRGDSAVWLTEQGGVRSKKKGKKYPTDPDVFITRTSDQTADDVARLVKLPLYSPRIKRFYYYSWIGGDSWDSGLIDYKTHEKRRRMYNIFAEALPRWPWG